MKSTFTAEDYKGQGSKLSPVAVEAAVALQRKFLERVTAKRVA